VRRSLRSILSIISHIGKLLFAYGLHYSGFLYLYGSWKLRNRAVVLMYHRVLPKDLMARSFSNRGIVVEVDTFRRQVAFISKYFSPVAAEQLIDFARDQWALPDKACVITFDDGWQDNYDYAFPVLRDFSTPATIFLPVSYIGEDRPFWQEHLASLLFRAWERGSRCEHCLARIGLSELSACHRPSHARQRIEGFVASCKMRAYQEIENLIQEVSDAIEVPPGDQASTPDRFMSWDQVQEMAQGPVTFGSHAVSHRILPRLPPDEQQRELSQSRAILEDQLGRTISLLAYPNGDYNDQVCRFAREAGYRMAFTTEPGMVSDTIDPFRVRRVNIHEGMTYSLPMFHCRILGIF
jgi:peptidoglycan/xylan/chitin deacetylase (PgdA/CDA1 family)